MRPLMLLLLCVCVSAIPQAAALAGPEREVDPVRTIAIGAGQGIALETLLADLPDTTSTAQSDEFNDVLDALTDSEIAEIIQDEDFREFTLGDKPASAKELNGAIEYLSPNMKDVLYVVYLDSFLELELRVEALNDVAQHDSKVPKTWRSKLKSLTEDMQTTAGQASLWIRTMQANSGG